MSKSKLIEDTIKYLKFHKDYNHYPVYSDELNVISDKQVVSFQKEESIIPEKKILISKEKNIEVAEVNDSKESKISITEDKSWMNVTTFEEFYDSIKNCSKCKLLAKSRKQIVFGSGNPNADVVVVGEAPGADEDEQGEPFVGSSGKLLTDILKAINFTREEIYICNILKCRPPENRNPLPEEITNCEPYLFKQLEIIKPRLILAVGAFAAQTLLKSKEPLGKLRGKFHLYKGIKMMVTYHPAALLRNPSWKRPTWEDVQLFRKEYDSIVNS